MNSKERSFEMAKRLKALREERNLSHVSLSDELKEMYGISISKDSLINYEISEDNRTRAQDFPNLKMKAEYLLTLANYYRVSTDYLLCKTDIKVPNVELKSICEYTGLSEQTVKSLTRHAQWFQPCVVDRFLGFCDLDALSFVFQRLERAIQDATDLSQKINTCLVHDWSECKGNLRFAHFDVVETLIEEVDNAFNYRNALKALDESAEILEKEFYRECGVEFEES